MMKRFRSLQAIHRRLPAFLKILIASLVLAGPTWAEVTLDKLNRCDDIQRLFTALKEEHPSFGPCRDAHSVIEAWIQRRFPRNGAADLCFLSVPPAPFVNGFSCLSLRSSPKALLCFRSSASTDIKIYKAQYRQRYAAAAKAYTKSAAACPVSNGDASESADTLMPALLKPLAKYELGFVSQLGNTIPAESLIHHGYATVYPDEVSGTAGALEFVDIYFGASPDVARTIHNWQTVGDWRVEIDAGDPAAEAQFARQLQIQRHLAAFVDLTGFSLQTAIASTFDEGIKKKQLAKWQDVIIESLGTHGFTVLTDEDLNGHQVDDLIREQFALQFGRHNDLATKTSATILASRSTPACARKGGLMMALVMTNAPEPGYRKDFGEVWLEIIGAQTLQSPTWQPRRVCGRDG